MYFFDNPFMQKCCICGNISDEGSKDLEKHEFTCLDCLDKMELEAIKAEKQETKNLG